MSTINESEKKRLQSLKEKKQAFKARGQLIKQALSNLDNPSKNNKIIFDDNFGEEQSTKDEQRPTEKRKKYLFDNEDNDNNEDSLWNETEFSFEKNKRKKIILGNDARFTLDNRFAEDNEQTEGTKIAAGVDQCDLQKEKERQLDILESILGAPVTVKNQETKTTTKKGLMIRYDPTENGHCEYEVKSMSQSETKEKKKKKKFVPEIEEPATVEVSKDVYYNISDSLTKNFKQEEGFSLLKAYGRKKEDTNVEDFNAPSIENNEQKLRFNFNSFATNAFKYDSSDNANADEVPEAAKKEVKDDNHMNSLIEYKDTLFFDSNDVRFNEAVRFFSTETASNEEFKNLRRELKMIVRTKIRKNEKKRQPWGRKRKIKIS